MESTSYLNYNIASTNKYYQCNRVLESTDYLEFNIASKNATYRYDSDLQANYAKAKKKEPNFEALRYYFNWMPGKVIKKTFQQSTQYARTPMSTLLEKNIYLLLLL